MPFTFRPLGWRDAWQVSNWRYPKEYAFYDLDLLPLLGNSLLHPLLIGVGGGGFYAVAYKNDPLAGVFSFLWRGDTVEIGLGLQPNLTGQGIGLAFVQAGLEFGRRTFAPRAFCLTVATFNQRAIIVYERAGFVTGKRFVKWVRGSSREFMEMELGDRR